MHWTEQNHQLRCCLSHHMAGTFFYQEIDQLFSEILTISCSWAKIAVISSVMFDKTPNFSWSRLAFALIDCFIPPYVVVAALIPGGVAARKVVRYSFEEDGGVVKAVGQVHAIEHALRSTVQHAPHRGRRISSAHCLSTAHLLQTRIHVTARAIIICRNKVLW